MDRVYCQHHRDRNILPLMIRFGVNSLGKQYICAVCSGVRVLNSGRIISLNYGGRYGFLSGRKENIFFHFSNLAHEFVLRKGLTVSYEVSFLEDARLQAINLKPVHGG